MNGRASDRGRLPGVYFVGGTSGAGKTTTSSYLRESFGVPVLELDDLQRAIMSVVPDHGRRVVVMRELARAALSSLLDVKAVGIVDGAWLEPADAVRLRGEHGAGFHPVYCGYHDIDVGPRLSAIRSAGRHWTVSLTDQDASSFLNKQVADSFTLRRQCEQFDLPYFDFTAPNSGMTALVENFRAWSNGGGGLVRSD